jgi:hypothetical protein
MDRRIASLEIKLQSTYPADRIHERHNDKGPTTDSTVVRNAQNAPPIGLIPGLES